MTDAEKIEEIWRLLTGCMPCATDGLDSAGTNDYTDLVDDIGRVIGDGRRWDTRTMPTNG